MSGSEPTVFVVDDDRSVRDSLDWLISSVHLRVAADASAAEFLEAYRPGQPGCLLADVRMPELSGLELQRELARRAIGIPVIIITGHGDVQMAVRAMKAGAFDFIEKPFNDQVLVEVVQRAVRLSLDTGHERARLAEMAARIDLLTPRERSEEHTSELQSH